MFAAAERRYGRRGENHLSASGEQRPRTEREIELGAHQSGRPLDRNERGRRFRLKTENWVSGLITWGGIRPTLSLSPSLV